MHGPSSSCQHNLYLCHCTPSSSDPSPIHPAMDPSPAAPTRGTVAEDNNPSAGGNKVFVMEPAVPSTECGNGGGKVYVTQTSVAVMTSPTLNLTSSKTSASLGSLTSISTPTPTANVAQQGPDLVSSANHPLLTNTIPR